MENNQNQQHVDNETPQNEHQPHTDIPNQTQPVTSPAVANTNTKKLHKVFYGLMVILIILIIAMVCSYFYTKIL